ncbi:Sec-independent protein translocase protein TatB [Desulfobacterales bacterium HSG2]|nr:Sec-independent protein translocase protein TatB [Desulfobacterales bacterium HSG2]
MFGIGMPEMLLILAVALIVIGPKKLPDLAKSLGRAIGEFKRAATDFKESMEIDSDLKEVKRAFDDMNNDFKTPIDVSPEPEKKSSGPSEYKGKDAENGAGKEKDSEKENKQETEGTVKNDK